MVPPNLHIHTYKYIHSYGGVDLQYKQEPSCRVCVCAVVSRAGPASSAVVPKGAAITVII